MSASLFYDCYADYESYPKTKYINGDLKFEDLKAGDILYCYGLVKTKGKYSMAFKELLITKPWHKWRGHCYITCKRGKKDFYSINFGPTDVWNVLEESPKSSVVWYEDTLIGTNKESIYTIKKEEYLKEIQNLEDQKKRVEYNISLLENAWKK